MKLEEAFEKYHDAFNEHFPIMAYRGIPDEEIISAIEEALKNGKPIDLSESDDEYPPVY